VQGVIETCNVLAMDWEAAQTAALDGGAAQRRKGMQPVQILARALRWLEGEPLQDIFEAEYAAGGLGGVPGGLDPPSVTPPPGDVHGSAVSLRSSSATPSELDAQAPAQGAEQGYPSQHPSPAPLTPLPESFTAPLRVLTLNNYAAVLVRSGNLKKAMSILRLVRAAAGVYNAEVAQWAAAFQEKTAEFQEWEGSTSADRAEYDQAMADIAGVQAKWDRAVAKRETELRRRVTQLLRDRADRLQRASQREERRLMAGEDLTTSAQRHAERVVAYRFAKGAHSAQVQASRTAYNLQVQLAQRRAASWDERRKEARAKAAERAAHLQRKAVRQEEMRQHRIAELAKSPLRKAADSERVDFKLVNPLSSEQLLPAARCLWKRDPTLPRVRERDEHGLKRLVAGSLPLSGKVKIMVKSARRVQPPITRAPGPGEWGFRRVTYLYVQARIGDVVAVTTAKPAKVDTISQPLPGAYPASVLRSTDRRDLDMNVYVAKWKQVVELSLHSGLNAAQHLHLALLSRTEFEPVLGGGAVGTLADSAAAGAQAPAMPPPPQEKDIILGTVTISMRSLVSRAMDKAIDVATVQPYNQVVEVGHTVNATTPLSWLRMARQLKDNDWNGREVTDVPPSPKRGGVAPRDGGPFGGEPGEDSLFISGELECGYGWQPDAEVLGGVLFRAAAEAAGGHGPDGEPLPGYEYLTGIPVGGATAEGLDAYMVKALTAAPPPAPAMGMLKVLIQQARKLVYPGSGKELTDTYLVARVGGSVARTRIVRNTNKPLWNEVLEVQIPTGFIDTAHLELRLYDQQLAPSVTRSGSARVGSAATSSQRARHKSGGSLAAEDDAVGVVRIRLQELMLGCIMDGTRHVEEGKRSKLAKLHAVEEAKWYNIRSTGAGLPEDWKQQALARASSAGGQSEGDVSEDDRSVSRGGSSEARGGETVLHVKPPRIGKVQLGYGWRPNRDALQSYILRVQDWVRAKAAARAALDVDADLLDEDGESSVETLDEETRALAEDTTTGTQVYPNPRAPPQKAFRMDAPSDMRSISSVSDDTEYSQSLSDIMLAVRQAKQEDPLEGLGARPVPPHLPIIPPQPEVPPPPPAMAPLTQTHLNLTAILSSVGRHGPALASAQSAVQECRRELRGARGLCTALGAQLQAALDGEEADAAGSQENEGLQMALGTAWGAAAMAEQRRPVAPGWKPSPGQIAAALHAARSTLIARRTALAVAYHALAIQLEHCGHPIQSVRHFQRAAALGKRATQLPEDMQGGEGGGASGDDEDQSASSAITPAEASAKFAGDLMDIRMAAMFDRDFHESAKLHRVEIDRKGAIQPAPRLKRNEYSAAAQAEAAAAAQKAATKAKAAARRAAEERGEDLPESDGEVGSDEGEGEGEDDHLADAVSVDSFDPYMGPPAFKEHHAPAHKLLKIAPEDALGISSIKGTTARRKTGTTATKRRGGKTMAVGDGSASTLPLRGMTAGLAATSLATGQPQPDDKDGMLARAAAIVVDVSALRREWGAQQDDEGGEGGSSDALSEPSHGHSGGHLMPPKPIHQPSMHSQRSPFAVEAVEDVSPGFRPPPDLRGGMRSGSVQARLREGVRRAERRLVEDDSLDSLQAAALAAGVPRAALRGDGPWATTAKFPSGGGAWGSRGGSSQGLLPPGKRSAGLGGSEPLDPETMAFVHRVLSHSHDEGTQSQIVQAYFSAEMEELQAQLADATAKSHAHLQHAKRSIKAAKADCGITATYALRILAAADAWKLLPANLEQNSQDAPSPEGTTPILSPPAPGFTQHQQSLSRPSVTPPVPNSRGFASRSLVASPVRRSPEKAPTGWPGQGSDSPDGASVTDLDEESVHEPMSSQSTLEEYRRERRPVARGGAHQESKASLGTSASNDSLHGRMDAIFGRAEADALIGSYGMTEPELGSAKMVARRPAPFIPKTYAPVAGSRAGTYHGRRVVSTSPARQPEPKFTGGGHAGGGMAFTADDISFMGTSDDGGSDGMWGDSSDAQLDEHRWAQTARPSQRAHAPQSYARSATAAGGQRGGSPPMSASLAFSAQASPGQQAAERSRKQGSIQAAITQAQVRSRRDARRHGAEQERWNEEHQYDVPHRAPVMGHDSDSDERPISHRELFLQPISELSYAPQVQQPAAANGEGAMRSVSPIATGPSVHWGDY